MKIFVNGIPTTVLLDTGSTVSTIYKPFNQENLRDVRFQDIKYVFKWKYADSSNLPYKGAVQLDILSEGLGDDKQHSCLFLILNDNDYYRDVPRGQTFLTQI